MIRGPTKILKIYPESFRANIYSIRPFRMIGLIDASVQYTDGIEKVTLAYFRSSGTNSGKIRGLWYPIVGIKIYTGRFTEFTEFLNNVLTNTTRNGRASEGWLAKSLFFKNKNTDTTKISGFSNGIHYESLLEIGKILRYLYEKDNYIKTHQLDAVFLNTAVSSHEIYPGNKHSQQENFENIIEEIFYGI